MTFLMHTHTHTHNSTKFIFQNEQLNAIYSCKHTGIYNINNYSQTEYSMGNSFYTYIELKKKNQNYCAKKNQVKRLVII